MDIRLAGLTSFLVTISLGACGKGEPTAQPAQPAPTAAPAPTPEPAKPPAEVPAEAPKAEPKPAEPAPAESPKEEPPKAEPAPAPGEGDEADGPPDMADQAIEAHAKTLMERWLAAQNDGDFERYAALYAPDFKGVRRTATGKPKEFDLEGWKADRKKMFEKKMEVAADGITIAPDKTPGVTVVTFTQRWRTGKYADHGQKVIKLRADADGVHRIIVEDMRTSTSGWEDARVKAVDLTSMTSPLTMRVFVDRRFPDRQSGDCVDAKVEIQIEDVKQRREIIPVGSVTGLMLEGHVHERAPLLPSKKGRYQDLGEWCAGLQSGWRIEKDGDFITATDIWTDEVTGYGRQRWVLVNLPAGADVSIE
jgi:ketosteroid isomerase-like protein